MSEGNRNELTSTSAEERTKAKPRSDEARGLSEESLAQVTGGMAVPPILTPIQGPHIKGGSGELTERELGAVVGGALPPLTPEERSNQ